MDLFFDAASLVPFNASSLSERPLGGTETAVIRVSEELAKIGHRVVVRTSEENARNRALGDSNPEYLSASAIVDYSKFNACLFIQNWRLIPFYFDRATTNTKIIFWTGDGSEQFSNVGVGDKRVVSSIDAMFTVSEFHKQSLCEASRFPLNKCFVVPNGVADVFFAKTKTGKNKCELVERDLRQMIYHSAPYRGLVYLLPYLKIIQQSLPEVHLEIFSDMDLYARGGSYRGPHAEVLPQLKAKYESAAGITFNQTVPQNALPPHLLHSAMFPYPCLVPEVFCMSLLEAMAAGVVPVVREIGALEELVSDKDLIIKGEPGTKDFDEAFVRCCVGLLKDKKKLKKKSNAMKSRAAKFTWQISAEKMISAIQCL